jgi:hypothetical protein
LTTPIRPPPLARRRTDPGARQRPESSGRSASRDAPASTSHDVWSLGMAGRETRRRVSGPSLRVHIHVRGEIVPLPHFACVCCLRDQPPDCQRATARVGGGGRDAEASRPIRRLRTDWPPARGRGPREKAPPRARRVGNGIGRPGLRRNPGHAMEVDRCSCRRRTFVGSRRAPSDKGGGADAALDDGGPSGGPGISKGYP